MPETPPKRKDFTTFIAFQPRWRDADVYGHINNAVFYEYVDTAVNKWLIESGALPVPHADPMGLVVHSECHFFAPLMFPDGIDAGLGVARIGTTSVTYRVGLFQGADEAAALSHFTHVYVDAATRTPKPLPDAFRAALQPLRVGCGF